MEIAHDLFLTDEERLRHLYIIGRTGMGKTNLLLNLALQDIKDGTPLIFIDPHGDAIHELLDTIPPELTEKTCFLDLTDTDYAVGFNPLANIRLAQRAVATAALVAAFKNVFYESWGPRLEWFLYNGLALLMEQDKPTLMMLPRLYYDDQYRTRMTKTINDVVARNFWQKEYPSYPDRYVEEAKGPILNKIGQFLASPQIRNVLCQETPKLDIRTVIERKQILLVNLAAHSGDCDRLIRRIATT